MDSSWTSGGLFVDSSWNGLLMDSGWTLHGLLVDSGWTPDGLLLDSRWTPGGLRLDSWWTQVGLLMDCKRTPPGVLQYPWLSVKCSYYKHTMGTNMTTSSYWILQNGPEQARHCGTYFWSPNVKSPSSTHSHWRPLHNQQNLGKLYGSMEAV